MENGQSISSNSVNDGLATAALLGAQRGYASDYDPTWKGIMGGGICDLRESVKDAECGIRSDVQTVKSDLRESLQNHNLSMVQQFSHVMDKACDAEKEAIRSQYEGKLQTIQTGKETDKGVMDARHDIVDRVDHFERSVADRFCSVEKAILSEAYETRRVVTDEGTRTREKIAECCCEVKERFGDLERRQNEQFCKLSEQHLRQTLAETKDELQEARFEAVLAKLGNGGGPGNSDK